MHNYDELLKITSDALTGCCFNGSPDELYEPARYTMTQGGKRIRPVMVLMSCEMFGGDILRALPAATGIEIFHNFTLVHDDIMDDAPLRRGKETVYKKWGANTAILSGDTMFAKAYEQIFRLDIPDLRPVLEVFTKTAIEVCEGQQFDMNFEKQSDVSSEAYLEMIRLKTAVLIACCLKTGALVAGASAGDTEKMYRFGENLGMAFQIQDDYLDTYGDKEIFGKMTGGDILAGKKTFLYVSACEAATASTRSMLHDEYAASDNDRDTKVQRITKLFDELGVAEKTSEAIRYYFDQATKALDSIAVPDERKTAVRDMASMLMDRKY